MYKYSFLLLIILASCFVCEGQKWFKRLQEKKIPNNISQSKLLVVEFEKSSAIKTANVAKRYNSRVQNILKRYYPYEYQVVNRKDIESMNIDSTNTWILDHREFERTYNSYTYYGSSYHPSRTTYMTHIYFFRTKGLELDEIRLYSSFGLKTFRMLMKAFYYCHPEHKKIHSVCAMFVKDKDTGAFRFRTQYQRSSGPKLYSWLINLEGGKDNIESKFKVPFIVIRPEARFYPLTKTYSKPCGIYLGTSLNFSWTKQTITGERLFSKTAYGSSITMGYELKILKSFLINPFASMNFGFTTKNGTTGDFMELYQQGYFADVGINLGYVF